MQIDRRITNGLAWAGAFLVVGVPTADLLSAQFLGDRAAPTAQIAVVEERPSAPTPAPQAQRPEAKPVEVAAVAPAKPAAQNTDVVENFVQSGRKLPSYISDAPAEKPVAPAAKPAETATVKPEVTAPAKPTQTAVAPAPARTPIITEPAAATDPVETASISPKVAPVPMPLSMRPEPVIVATANPVAPSVVFPANEPVFVPPSVQPAPQAEITAEDLEDWETGPLADFLARRQAPQQAQIAPRYNDDDEFFFDRDREFQQRDRLIGQELFFYP
ncbi:hypothetical protein [Devosia naphthalenivorans]|uniref:hypothetical protein n=1 Tax=Devosia naphthalenivorans TaxID=2082392 RepID=UPI000D38945E|nr:hypothetical protein [Devosia naphthalenivorans]